MKRVEEGAGELVISRGDSAVDLVLFNFSEAPKPEQIKYVVG
jgi:hypothetical protein